MILQAASDLGLDLPCSVIVGDEMGDIERARGRGSVCLFWSDRSRSRIQQAHSPMRWRLISARRSRCSAGI
jgi:histidinol phosphatase-like enzyme